MGLIIIKQKGVDPHRFSGIVLKAKKAFSSYNVAVSTVVLREGKFVTTKGILDDVGIRNRLTFECIRSDEEVFVSIDKTDKLASLNSAALTPPIFFGIYGRVLSIGYKGDFFVSSDAEIPEYKKTRLSNTLASYINYYLSSEENIEFLKESKFSKITDDKKVHTGLKMVFSDGKKLHIHNKHLFSSYSDVLISDEEVFNKIYSNIKKEHAALPKEKRSNFNTVYMQKSRVIMPMIDLLYFVKDNAIDTERFIVTGKKDSDIQLTSLKTGELINVYQYQLIMNYNAFWLKPLYDE